MFKLILVKGVKPVFFIEILSVLCMSYHTQATMLPWYHAKRYPGFQSNINWARFLPPSPHDMSFGDYHGKNWEFEPTEGGIEDTSMKGSNQDVSTCLLHNISNRFLVYIILLKLTVYKLFYRIIIIFCKNILGFGWH